NRTDALDFRIFGIDQIQRSGESIRLQVRQHLAADRGFAWACADQRERPRRKHLIESVCAHGGRKVLTADSKERAPNNRIVWLFYLGLVGNSKRDRRRRWVGVALRIAVSADTAR